MSGESPLVPRKGWTLEQEYRALVEEFLTTEESRDRLAAENEQLRSAEKRQCNRADEAEHDRDELREAIRQHRERTEAMTHSSHAAYIDADLWAFAPPISTPDDRA